MVDFCGFVIYPSCFDFVFEIAKSDGFAVGGDLGVPSLLFSAPGDAFVF